jgi:4-amino-4-deoxy-L-arabinose transferase-like glycosyltransferase
MRPALRHPALAGLALFTAIAAVARIESWRAPILNDTGQYLYVAETLLDGGTPYVDAANNKGPVTYLLFALIKLISGTHPTLIRASLLLFAGLAALALAGYVAHFAGRAAGVVAGVTFALLAGTPALEGSDPNTEQFGVAPMAGAWYLATRGSARSSAAAGAVAASAVLMNPAFAVVLPFVGWELWRSAPAGRRRRLLAAAGGAAALAAPIALWLLAAGALDDFQAQVLGHAQRVSSPGTLSGGAYDDLSRRLHGVRFLVNVPAGGLWVAGLAACGIACQDRRLRAGAVPAALWIVVAWLRVKSATYEYPHHYYPALPGIAAGIALGLAAVWQPVPARRIALVVLVLTLAAWPYVVAPQWGASENSRRDRYREQYPVARFLSMATAESDRIFVPGLWSQLYWLSGRRAPTRFFDNYVHLERRSFAIERRRDLLTHPPRAIVQMPGEVLGPEERSLLRREPYRLAYDLRGARVWLRS